MWLVARAEVLQTAQPVSEQLRKEVARSEAMEHELVGLRSTVDRLQNEVSHLCLESDDAWGNADHLQE